jgi:hypothetical protein
MTTEAWVTAEQVARQAQARAILGVNAEMVRLYWDIGALIHARHQQQGWVATVIPRLVRDLHNELPDEEGFSKRNIKRMLAFYREYADLAFVPQPVAQIQVLQATALFSAELILVLPWGHHAELMAKAKDPAARQWYMCASIENGWSRNVLLMQIETAAHQRMGNTTSTSRIKIFISTCFFSILSSTATLLPSSSASISNPNMPER